MAKKQANMQALEEFIRDFVAQKHFPPTIRECCKGIGVRSTSTVHLYLSEMKEAGILTFDESKPRTIRLLR